MPAGVVSFKGRDVQFDLEKPDYYLNEDVNRNIKNLRKSQTPRKMKNLKRNNEIFLNDNESSAEKKRSYKRISNNNVDNEEVCWVPETPRNKRFRIVYTDDEDDNGETSPVAKYHKSQPKISPKTSNKELVSLDNFKISPMSFYSKKLTETTTDRFSPVKSPKVNSATESISSKIEALMAKKQKKLVKDSRKNHKNRINKQIYPKAPKLGNHGVGHKIRRPKKSKKIKVDSGKVVKLLTRNTSSKNIKSSERIPGEVFQIIINNSKKSVEIEYEDKGTQNSKDDSGSESENDDGFDSSDDELSLPQTQNDHNQTEEEVNTSPLGQRKFFKTRGKPIKNECKMMGNLKVTMKRGKLFVLSEKKSQKFRKHRSKKKEDFSKERAVVSDIIQRLSCSPEPLLPSEDVTDTAYDKTANNQVIFYDDCTTTVDSFPTLIDHEEFTEFRNRIPYNTNDPKVIEQQHLLLDFLISHNICNEENFRIFIADPDSHKEKAGEIVDSLTIVVPTSGNGGDEGANESYESESTHLSYDLEQIDNNNQNVMPEYEIEQAINSCADNSEISNNTILINNLEFVENSVTETAQIEYNSNNEEIQVQMYDDNATMIGCDVRDPGERTLEAIDEIGTDSSYIQNVQLLENNTNSFNDIQIVLPESCDSILPPCNQDENTSDNTTEIISNSDKNDTQKLFPLFYPGSGKYKIIESAPVIRKRNTLKALGINQYQIDAGQKEFGAKQCLQCGLLYSIHEPEEEKLHMEYHQSLHILRFKGWIDENVVKEYPEWGADGRIISITDSSHIKRKERLMNVLSIVDRELGFNSYIFPSKFIAYLAIRRQRIVGLCLVQPLDKANKYMCLNGVDCCTEEFYEAKCGISRIWVSSLHRRMGIASKLILAARMNTTPGQEISLDQIAFSAPTEDGKLFARKITKRDDFLVYQ